MITEIKELHDIIKDYRKQDNIDISEERIKNWINQFKEDDRIFILKEMKIIFEKMYLSKEKCKVFITQIVKQFKETFNYSSYKEFLDNSNFLDLQTEGKSQKQILELLYEILEKEFNYHSKDLGSVSHKHNIYIDDVLCTGNTFFNNINQWATENNKIDKLRSKEIDLTIVYICAVSKYFNKKQKQFYHRISNDFTDLYKALSFYWIDEAILKPIDSNLTSLMIQYKEKVEEQANKHAENKGFSSYSSDFFRKQVNPETFYSSIENRKRLESIFLEKGIEILNNSNISKTNIRPLGYSLPAYKDFGFGMLFFTWRNVANNTPIVFWYKNGGFIPLFINKR